MGFTISDDFIAEKNRAGLEALEEDYAHLGRQLGRNGVDIERLTERALAFRVSVPSWGVGTALGARSHTVWIADGGNFPGQVHFRRAVDRYLESPR